MEGTQRRLWQLSVPLQQHTRWDDFTVLIHTPSTHTGTHRENASTLKRSGTWLWIFLGEGSHYDLDFLSVRKDYVIYFLSKLLWRDYTLERCGGLKVCPACLPSLRQRSVFAAYVEPVSRFENGTVTGTQDRRTDTDSWCWSSDQDRSSSSSSHSFRNKLCYHCTALRPWWTLDIPLLSCVCQ